MEPHATVATWTGDHLTIYTATQGVRLVVGPAGEHARRRRGEDPCDQPLRRRRLRQQVGQLGAYAAHRRRGARTGPAGQDRADPGAGLHRRRAPARPPARPSRSAPAGTARWAPIKHDGISSKSASSSFSENAARHLARVAVRARRTCTPARRSSRWTSRPPPSCARRGRRTGPSRWRAPWTNSPSSCGMDPLDAAAARTTPPRCRATAGPGPASTWTSATGVGAERFGWSRRHSTPGAAPTATGWSAWAWPPRRTGVPRGGDHQGAAAGRRHGGRSRDRRRPGHRAVDGLRDPAAPTASASRSAGSRAGTRRLGASRPPRTRAGPARRPRNGAGRAGSPPQAAKTALITAGGAGRAAHRSTALDPAHVRYEDG